MNCSVFHKVLLYSIYGGDLMWKETSFADDQDESNRLAGPIQYYLCPYKWEFQTRRQALEGTP